MRLLTLSCISLIALHSQTPTFAPTPIAPTPTADIKIDGRTGRTTGNLQRTQCERATVAIINKQPFLYQYAFDGKTTLIPEPGLTGLAQIFGTTLALLEPPATGGGGGPAPGGGAPTATIVNDPNQRANCPAATQILAVSAQFQSAARTFRADIKTLYQKHNASKSTVDANWAILQDFGSLQADLEKAATTIVAEETKLIQRKADLQKLSGDLDTVSGLATTLIALTEDKPCGQAFAAERFAAQLFLDAAAQYRSLLDVMTKDNKAIDEILKFTKKILSDANRYDEIVPGSYGPFGDPTKVDWTLKLSQWKGDGTNEFKGSFAFGSPRFYAAAGLAFSPMNVVQYARVDSVSAAGEKIVKVGRSAEANFRVQPIAMVHARMNSCKVSDFPIYLSAGITAKGDNKGTVPEYLIGLSTSFVNQRIFVTAGAYIGQRQNLQGGLREGDTVPSALAELPVSKGYTSAFGFALTYRFK
jgi:hypothetical protein